MNKTKIKKVGKEVGLYNTIKDASKSINTKMDKWKSL